MSQRDLFANFDRMRREMDELFGDALDRPGLAHRRVVLAPAVDVYYTGEPPRAVVVAELAGIDLDELRLEIDGRELVLSGLRRPGESEGRLYQHLEIGHGPFRRTVQLGADVRGEEARAVYEDGLLRVELPLRDRPRSRSVPIEVPRPTPAERS